MLEKIYMPHMQETPMRKVTYAKSYMHEKLHTRKVTYTKSYIREKHLRRLAPEVLF